MNEQPVDSRVRRIAPSAVLCLCLSLPVAIKYGGAAGVVALCAAHAVVMAVALFWRWPTLHGRTIVIGFVVLAAGLVAVFVIGYHLAHSGALGVGSDRSDALNVALERLVDGQYPYTGRTYLGNEITPLPGALLLAAPARFLLGDAAWQNVFAWLLFLLGLAWVAGRADRAVALVAWLVGTVTCLEAVREFVTGDDLLVSGIYAALAVMLVLRHADARWWLLIVSGVILGVAVCSRPHVPLIVLVVVVYLAVKVGWRRAVVVGSTACASMAALIVPFLIWDAAGFSPIHVAGKVTSSTRITPSLMVLTVIATVLLLAPMWHFVPRTPLRVALMCGVPLIAPTGLAVAHGLLVGSIDVTSWTFAAAGLPFFSYAMVVHSPRNAAEPRATQGVVVVDAANHVEGARRLRA